MTATITSKIVGDLKCQHEPYLTSFNTKVVSCEVAPSKPSNKKNKKSSNSEETLYHIELEDTILFPEGGGQPNDTGFIGDVEVIDVQRDGLKCYHITKEPIETGTEVELKLNFERRWDHMQQHSGQHLVSAVFETLYELDTLSWSFGESRCCIEIPIKPKNLTKEMLNKAELECNRLIREARPITVESYNLDDPNSKRPPTLPDDYVGGIVRYVVIKDYDYNACCGTPVASTAHIQFIKFIQVESSGANNSKLYFVIGDRVLNMLQQGLERDLKLTSLLSSGPDSYADKIQILQQRGRDLSKQLKSFSSDMAGLVSDQIIDRLTAHPVVAYHRSNADPDFLKILQSNLKPTIASLSQATADPKVIIISSCPPNTSSCPPNTSSGPLMILGHPDLVPKVSQYILDQVTLKGAMSGPAKWQGKGTDLDKLAKLYPEIEAHFQESKP